jgi:hypothetical protein
MFVCSSECVTSVYISFLLGSLFFLRINELRYSQQQNPIDPPVVE